MSDPATTANGLILLCGVFGGIPGGLACKLLYDRITANKNYVTKEDCEKSQEGCPAIKSLEIKLAVVETNQKNHDAYLVSISKTIQKVNDNVNKLKTGVAVIVAKGSKK